MRDLLHYKQLQQLRKRTKIQLTNSGEVFIILAIISLCISLLVILRITLIN